MCCAVAGLGTAAYWLVDMTVVRHEFDLFDEFDLWKWYVDLGLEHNVVENHEMMYYFPGQPFEVPPKSL